MPRNQVLGYIIHNRMALEEKLPETERLAKAGMIGPSAANMMRETIALCKADEQRILESLGIPA